MMSKMVGATSASAPGSEETSKPPLSPVTMNGTWSIHQQESFSGWGVEQRTGGVGGVGVTSLWVQHLLGVSVVGSDTQNVASLLASVIDSLDSLVGSSNSDDGSIVITSMADHVGRSKVAHDEFVFAGLDDFGDLVCDSLDAHLGLFVVCGDLGGRNHVSLLALELLLDTSVEEEGDMGILFGLYSESAV